MEKITIRDLIKHINDKYQGDALIKICTEASHAEGLAKGEVCLGTFEYFRKNFQGEGRSGEKDGVFSKEFVVGEEFDSPLGKTTINLPDLQGEKGRVEYILTGLIFCLFHFTNKTNIDAELIKSKGSLGKYFVVFESHKTLGEGFRFLQFDHTLTNNIVLEPKIEDGESIFCREVDYVDVPDGGGFQKQKEYSYQNEYRFCFKIDGFDAPKIYGSLSAQFIFKTHPLECELFEIID